jgi:organic radical activating enzyme
MSPPEIFKELKSRTHDMLVISGGEPLLQQAALVPVLRMCNDEGWRVEIETAGTIPPLTTVSDTITQFNVSPKLMNSGNAAGARIREEALLRLRDTGKAVWKFVVAELSDLAEVDGLVAKYDLSPVYIMPEGVDPVVVNERAKVLAEHVLARNWALTLRLQLVLWGNKRGV